MKTTKTNNTFRSNCVGGLVYHKKATAYEGNSNKYIATIYNTNKGYRNISINLGIVKNNEIIDEKTAYKLLLRDIGLASLNDLKDILTEKQIKSVVAKLGKKYGLTPN